MREDLQVSVPFRGYVSYSIKSPLNYVGGKYSFRPLSGLCLLFKILIIYTNLLKTSFRPLSGLCLLFSAAIHSGRGRRRGFRPLSGLCLLFLNNVLLTVSNLPVSVPFRGYVSYSPLRLQHLSTPDKLVSVPFRGYVSYSKKYWHPNPNLNNVSVPFRGYVSYSYGNKKLKRNEI